MTANIYELDKYDNLISLAEDSKSLSSFLLEKKKVGYDIEFVKKFFLEGLVDENFRVFFIKELEKDSRELTIETIGDFDIDYTFEKYVEFTEGK